jgi:hypothetical protein
MCRESGVTSKNVSSRLLAAGPQPWVDPVAGEACAWSNALALKDAIAARHAASTKSRRPSRTILDLLCVSPRDQNRQCKRKERPSCRSLCLLGSRSRLFSICARRQGSRRRKPRWRLCLVRGHLSRCLFISVREELLPNPMAPASRGIQAAPPTFSGCRDRARSRSIE